jgi:hypothetical protein
MYSTDKKKPTGSSNSTAGGTDALMVSTRLCVGKVSNAPRGASAQQRYTTAALDGNTTYWAERWGLVRGLATRYDAALLLAQIGGSR